MLEIRSYLINKTIVKTRKRRIFPSSKKQSFLAVKVAKADICISPLRLYWMVNTTRLKKSLFSKTKSLMIIRWAFWDFCWTINMTGCVEHHKRFCPKTFLKIHEHVPIVLRLLKLAWPLLSSAYLWIELEADESSSSKFTRSRIGSRTDPLGSPALIS